MPTSHEVRERLAARQRFSLAEVRRWMATDGDLELWAAVYDVLGPGWKLIKPEPDMEETCEFITRYLLRCIHENVQDHDRVPTGYDAAHDLANCLKLWAAKLPQTDPVLTNTASKITDAYRIGDEAERDRLLNGMLEHALESTAVRPYFAPWKNDAVLGEAWQLAMEWAVAHGD
ncbi:MAG TPA: hypothetical protein VFE47_23930 [Tepidisphaeraceae bacterium]|jgi:hypothetical protein|nr:hypothetical protein [Tepidisphaeraceae bacterium]